MAKDQKPEKSKTQAPVKSNGKRKVGPPEQAPIIPSSTSSNIRNSKSTEDEKNPVEASRKDDSATENGDVLNINSKEKDNSSILYQIPMSRVSRIIKTEDPNVRITQEAVFIINKASEKFLQVFTTEAYANAFLDRKKHIDYKNLSSVVSKRRRFDFLSDFVPEKVKAEDALKEVSSVEM